MGDQEFSWKGALIVFWAITWRCCVVLIPLIIIFSIIFAIVGGIMGMDQGYITNLVSIIVQLICIPVYISVLKRLFTKGFGKFRLAIVEKE